MATKTNRVAALFERLDAHILKLLNTLDRDFERVVDEVFAIANRSSEELTVTATVIYQRAVDLRPYSMPPYARLCREVMDRLSTSVRQAYALDASNGVLSGGPLFRAVLVRNCSESLNSVGDISHPGNAAPRRKDVLFFSALLDVNLPTLAQMHDYLGKLVIGVKTPSIQVPTLELLCDLLQYTNLGVALDRHEEYTKIMDRHFQSLRDIALDKGRGVPLRLVDRIHDLLSRRRRNWIPLTFVPQQPASSNALHSSHERQTPKKDRSCLADVLGTPARFASRRSAKLEPLIDQAIKSDIAGFYNRDRVGQLAEYFKRYSPDWHVKLVQRLVDFVFETGEEGPISFVSRVFAECASSKIVSSDSFKKGFSTNMEVLDARSEDNPQAYRVMATLLRAASLSLSDVKKIGSKIRPHIRPPRDKLFRALSKLE